MNRFLPARALDWLFWASTALYLAILHVENVIALRNLAFFGMLLTTVLLLARTKQRPQFPFWQPWLLYAAVALISLSYSIDPAYSARNIKVELGYGALALIVAATWSRWSPSLDRFLSVLIAVNALLAVALYSSASFGDPMEKIQHLAPLANAGVNSNFLVSVLPLLALAAWWFWHYKRYVFAGAAVILIVADLGALVLSYNRQSFVAVLASILCAGVLTLKYRFSWRRLGIFLTLLALIVTLLGLQLARRSGTERIDRQEAAATFADDVRWDLWQFSLDKIEKKPFTGSGFGRETFGKAYPEVIKVEPSMFLWHAHNMVINKGVQMGIPGMAAFLLLWLTILRELGRHLGTTSTRHALAVAAISLTVAVFVKNMTDDHFLRDPAFLYWLLIGMSIGTLRRLENEATPREPAGQC